MAYLYRINEYLEHDNFISFRKQFFHKKNKDFVKILEDDDEETEDLKKYDDPNYQYGKIRTYIRDAEDFILLKNFEEATKCLDPIIEYNQPHGNVRAYFLKGFMSYI